LQPKIRIFALSKELEIDSKVLIQHCVDAGLDVKSSALASITPEEKDVLMAHLAKIRGGGGGKESPPPKETLERPARPRELRDLSAPPPIVRRPPRKEHAHEDDEPTVAVEPPATPLVKPVSEEPPQPVAPAPEVVAESVPESPSKSAVPPVFAVPTAPPERIVSDVPVRPTSTRLNPLKTIAPKGGRSGQTPKEPSTSPPKAVAPPIAPPPELPPVRPRPPVAPPVAPLTPTPQPPQPPVTPVVVARVEPEAPADATPVRADQPASRGLGSIREMQARGTVRDAESKTESRRREREKERKEKGPSLPALAAGPSFKLQAPTVKAEGPAMKPDLVITAEVLRNTKLSDMIKKREETTKKPDTEEEARSGKGKGRGAVGTSLEDSREQRRRGRQKKRGPDEDENVIVKVPKRHRRSGGGSTELKTSASIELPITVRSFSEALGRPSKDILGVLFRTKGVMATINDPLDEELALEIAMEFGVELTVKHEEDFEDVLEARLSQTEFDVPLLPRPPIITILGHVDHGKTTLVDRIRSANVAASEAGGITQHIAAYQVEHNGHRLTFVDTPGHAAFGEMRARGANVTDIVVLVVAADDGVMPQTVECISHAKAAGVPIVVAMNKIDLPGANEQKVLSDLSNHGLLPQEWGGDVEVIRVSALKGTGIDDLLETLLLVAEISDLKAPVDIPAEGVCLEAFRDEGRGPIAWTIVRRGTLRVGDVMLCGPAIGRVRALYNDRDEELEEAGPSTPVRIAGLDQVPGAGDKFFVMPSIEEARRVAEERQLRGRDENLSRRGGMLTLEEFFTLRDGSLKELPLIIKADTPGSIEAIRHELNRFDHNEVRIRILHEAVGGVNESDVYLASSSGAIIIAFHVVAEDRAESLASQEGVEIRRYNIIYNVADDIRQALEGLLSPEKVEVSTGRALVLRTFSISKVGTVAGCRVLNGTIERNNRVHVIRDQKILNDYAIASLRREKDDAREVREGYECGIRLDGFNDVKEGDILEAFRIEERKRSLDD
jgi:translation initiation factor IF-2